MRDNLLFVSGGTQVTDELATSGAWNTAAAAVFRRPRAAASDELSPGGWRADRRIATHRHLTQSRPHVCSHDAAKGLRALCGKLAGFSMERLIRFQSHSTVTLHRRLGKPAARARHAAGYSKRGGPGRTAAVQAEFLCGRGLARLNCLSSGAEVG